MTAVLFLKGSNFVRLLSGYYSSLNSSPNLLKHGFHCSAPSWKANVDHPLIHFVDWAKVKAGYYACADPNDGQSLLYYSDREYKIQLHVSMSTFTPLVVIARPTDSKPGNGDIPNSNPKPQSSPDRSKIYEGLGLHGRGTVFSRFRSQFWPSLKDGNSVAPTERNLSSLIAQWAHTLWVWCGFPPSSKALGQDVRTSTGKLRSVLKNQGALGLILYLKVSYLAIQKFVAGTPMSSTWELGTRVRLANGLPAWLPVSARKAIRSRHKPSIRLWLSILYTFKAMKSPNSYSKVHESILKVTSPKLDVTETVAQILGEYRSYLRDVFIPSIGGRRPTPVIPMEQKSVASKLFKAGPNGSPAVLNAGKDAVAWINEGCFPIRVTYSQLDEELLKHNIKYEDSVIGSTHHEASDEQPLPNLSKAIPELQVLLQLSHPVRSKRLLRLIDLMYLNDDTGKSGLHDFLDQASLRENKDAVSYQNNHGTSGRPVGLGRIHALFEAAGKVRLIGILDYWSQRALKPLHDDLFSILKEISFDGTFDQNKLWHDLLGASKLTKANISSLDISSATDIIPKELYEIILDELYDYSAGFNPWTNGLMTPSYGSLVLGLMTDRDYLIPFEDTGHVRDSEKGGVSHKPHSWEYFESQGIYTRLQQGSHGFTWPCVQYTRGQPMGAYASFALLALWHHTWIQFSAYRVGMTVLDAKSISSLEGPQGLPLDVSTYGVVGDDSTIVEFNPSSTHATEYLSLCDQLSITIKISKSFPSCNAVSFLSRFATADLGEVSPASFREELHVDSLTNRANFVGKLIDRGFLDESRDWIGGLLRLSMDHYMYMLKVLPWRHFGRLPILGYRALLTLLGPNSPLVGRLERRELLIIWLALCQGCKPNSAIKDPGKDLRFNPSPALGVSAMLIQRLIDLLIKEIQKTIMWNRLQMKKVGSPEWLDNKLTASQRRLLMMSHYPKDHPFLSMTYRTGSWYKDIVQVFSPKVYSGTIRITAQLKKLLSITGPGQQIIFDQILNEVCLVIDYATSLHRAPNEQTNWLLAEPREARLTKPYVTWEHVHRILAEVAYEHWLLVRSQPCVPETITEYQETLIRCDEEALLSLDQT